MDAKEAKEIIELAKDEVCAVRLDDLTREPQYIEAKSYLVALKDPVVLGLVEASNDALSILNTLIEDDVYMKLKRALNKYREAVK